MKCQRKYQWVKLPRNCLPQGKGVLGHWARLAARAAYRKGIGIYCGFENEVLPGMWAGGVVGLKSILGTRSRRVALETLEQLQELGYLSYSLDSATKKLEYTLLDWVANCSGQACRDQGVYALQGTGFLCLPRDIPDRLVGHVFEEADAWLDLWCHTVWQEPRQTAPAGSGCPGWSAPNLGCLPAGRRTPESPPLFPCGSPSHPKKI